MMKTQVFTCLLLVSCRAAPMDYWDQIQEYRSYLPNSLNAGIKYAEKYFYDVVKEDVLNATDYFYNNTIEEGKADFYDLIEEGKEDFYDLIEEGKEDFYDLIQNVTMNLTKTIDQAKKNASDLFDYIKEEGNYVVYDLYDVMIREEAMNRTSEHVDALTELMTSFTDRVMDIHEDVLDVLSQDGALTDEEIKKRNDEEGLEELRELFDDIEEELKEEAAENDHLPEGVEKVIQTFLTTIRRMMASTSDKEAEFWSKLKQMEVKFWEIKAVLANTTIQLKEEIPSIIQTLQEADMELADYLEESIEFEDVPRAAFS